MLIAHRIVAHVVVTIEELAQRDGFPDRAPERKSALVNRIGKIKENGAPPKRFVIIASESVDKAKAWDATPAQQEVNALAEKSLKSRRFIVEGM